MCITILAAAVLEYTRSQQHAYKSQHETILVNMNQYTAKQVDILISKNQALQIIYLKHHLYETL